MDDEFRKRQRLRHSPRAVRRDFGLHELRRWVRPGTEGVPPSEFDRTELGVLERIPVDEAGAAEHVVVPREQGEVVLDGMVGEPLDVFVFDAGGADRAPELGGPPEDAEHVIGPLVPATGDRTFRVVAELVEHRRGLVPGDLGGASTHRLVQLQVRSRELVVGLPAEGTQDHAGERVVREVHADVGSGGDRVHDRANFRLRRGVAPGSWLVALGFPVLGEVPVEVDALLRGRHRHAVRIEVVDNALGEQSVEGSVAHIVHCAGHHQARIVRMDGPRTIGILDPHQQDAPVAVSIAFHQARLLFRPGVGARG